MYRIDMVVSMWARSICLCHCDSTGVHYFNDIYGSFANGIGKVLANLSTRMEGWQFATGIAGRALLCCDCVFDLLFRSHTG